METIIGALISAFVSVAVCVSSNHAQNEKNRALLDYRMTQLEQKVDKHNNLIERMYKVEQDVALQFEMIKVANHRIDDLEKPQNNEN